MNGKDALTKLSTGACPTNAEQPVTAVVVKQNSEQSPVCPAGPTEAIILDSNKIAQGACVEASFPVDNTTPDTQVLRFGAFGRSGDYQLLNESPIASDSAGVISTDYGAAGNNVMGIQRFNYLVELTAVVISYFRVRGIDTAVGNQQKNQRLKYRTYFYDKESQCQNSYISPACDTCYNNTDDGVRTFNKQLPLDGLHSVDYPLLAGNDVTIEIGILGSASARNYVPCNGNY